MDSALLIAFIVFFVVGVCFFVLLEYRRYAKNEETLANIRRAQMDVSSAKKEMQGFTKYADYLPSAVNAVVEQSKNLSVRVVREQVHVETIVDEKAKPPTESSLVVKYSVDYVFGFDLRPDVFQIISTPAGVEIKINRPTLLSTPTVKPVPHGSGGKAKPTDEQMAVVKKLPSITQGQAAATALDEAVIALCEKKLIAFVRDLLAQQPGVKQVPFIAIVYK